MGRATERITEAVHEDDASEDDVHEDDLPTDGGSPSGRAQVGYGAIVLYDDASEDRDGASYSSC